MDIFDLITRIRLPFLRDRGLYRSLYKVLGFYPRNIHPYKVAILHRSAAVREEGKRINNERLEFLGDAILGAVVGHIVFRHFPKKPEGFLTNARSNIVKRQSLNKLAQETGFDKLIVSNFKQQTHNSNVNGNAFEALIGAIYLDRGYAHCVRFVKRKVVDQLVNIEKAANEVNHKSKLIEWGQKHRIAINFSVRESKENDATPVFQSKVIIGGVMCGSGKGYSKKESQQAAAKQAMERLRSDKALRDKVMGQEEPAPEAVPAESPENQNIQNIREIQNIQNIRETPDNPETKNHKEEAGATPEESIDIDFSDITMKEKSREQIIAEAEQKAYSEE